MEQSLWFQAAPPAKDRHGTARRLFVGFNLVLLFIGASVGGGFQNGVDKIGCCFALSSLASFALVATSKARNRGIRVAETILAGWGLVVLYALVRWV